MCSINSTRIAEIGILIALPFALILFMGCAGNGEEKQTITTAKIEPLVSKTTAAKETQKQQKLEFENTSSESPDENNNTESMSPVDSSFALNQQTEPTNQTESDDNTLSLPQLYIFHFETNKSDVMQADFEHLRKHAQFLQSNPGMILKISGHADERGTEKYNMELSKKRAREVARQLSEFGISQSQIETIGFGEDQPLNGMSDWDDNRRVELEYINNFKLTSR